MLLKIGDLAKRVGLTVRTLHHYDKIRLLCPSARSDGGFRLYGHTDVIRLHRIQALKQFGYGLGDIQTLLNATANEPLEIIRQQIFLLDEQAKRALDLRKRLTHLEQKMVAGSTTGISDWLTILEMMTMHEKHLSEKDLAQLHSQSADAPLALGAEWTQLIAEVQAGMDRGLAPDTNDAQELAWRWMRQLQTLTGNHAGLAVRLRTMLESEERVQEIIGIRPAMLSWIFQSWANGRLALIAKHIPPTAREQVRRRMLAHIDEWPPLMALLRAQLDAGVSPRDPSMQTLAKRWQTLFRETYCGDDENLEAQVRIAFQTEPDLMIGIGFDSSVHAYVQHALMQLNAGAIAEHGFTADAGPKPSAMLVANLRAAHQLIDSPLIFEDPLALPILGDEAAAQMRKQAQKFKDPMSTALRTSLVVRSRLAEDECADAIQRGVRQTVILGAGLDTYAYRNAADSTARIFEVDLPATQQWKRDCLRKARIAEPSCLTYVPIDFERSTLQQALLAVDFRQSEAAFFSWLGVTMYLDEEAITNTLRFIASCAKGTSVVFDYLVSTTLLTPMGQSTMEFLASRVAARGEPWKTSFDPAKLADMLRGFGFGHIQHFTPQDLTERYLGGRQDGLRLGGMSRLIRATV